MQILTKSANIKQNSVLLKKEDAKKTLIFEIAGGCTFCGIAVVVIDPR